MKSPMPNYCSKDTALPNYNYPSKSQVFIITQEKFLI